MKLLWVCSLTPGAVLEHSGSPNTGTGLWLDHVLDDLRETDMDIRVLFAGKDTSGTVNEHFSYQSYSEGLPYIYLPELEQLFAQEIRSFDPDVIHIWGTEYGHTLAMVNAAQKTEYLDRVVVSIQGLCSVLARHYVEGVPYSVQRQSTFRDVVRRDNIRQQQRKFAMRGELEEQALRKVRHVIGRTDWDEACTKQLNPTVHYYFCNETLRDPFYQGNWEYSKCKKHRIFASSCVYPIKGFHYLLEALSIVAKIYPDVTLAVPGKDPLKLEGTVEKLREARYPKYLAQLIRRYHLEEKVEFLGNLSAEQMKQAFLDSNVFVLPSTIENSPNSMGEAMLLGVPCVASHVGGVAELLVHKKEGFVYQSTAPYMLAHYIMEVFAMEEAAEEMGAAAKKHAMQTHSPEKNLERLMDIYRDISESTQK